jgi:hypothetical protein
MHGILILDNFFFNSGLFGGFAHVVGQEMMGLLKKNVIIEAMLILNWVYNDGQMVIEK